MGNKAEAARKAAKRRAEGVPHHREAQTMRAKLPRCIPDSELVGTLTPLLYRWEESDIERWLARAKKLGARVVVKRSRLKQIQALDYVPAEPFRVAYEANDAITPSAITAELAILESRDGEPSNAYGSERYKDRDALHEALGVGLQRGTPPIVAIFIPYRLAEACSKAMGLTPYEVGI